MQTLQRVKAVTGRGLEGDRYFSNVGTYSKDPGTGRHVTLLELEAIKALRSDYAIDLAPALSRRNIVTYGVALNDLVGREFQIGEAILRGMRLCDPCSYLEKLTRQGMLRALMHRGGLRADVLTGGIIQVGDSIAPLDRARR